MKTIYTLSVSLMNGTVVMRTENSSYTTEELAKKAKEAVDRANGDSVMTEISESYLYEDESEVPILNKDGRVY